MTINFKNLDYLVLKKMVAIILAGIVFLLFFTSLHAAENQLISYPGNIPEGVWVLNQERSRKFMPGDHALWIIKDDGHRLVWVSVEIDPQERVRVTSWDGIYDGEPMVVAGSGMKTTISSPEKGRMVNQGTIPEFGSYKESCTVMLEEKRMLCEFTLTTEEGSSTYIDDFDWVSPGPLVIPSAK